MSKKDIILVTVDSWRYDTTGLVPNLSKRLSGPVDLICAGAATNWVFPAILSSQYYPSAYRDDGSLRSDLISLPNILSEAGYQTAGFVACNPYVSKWADHFDTFWNGNLSQESSKWYSSTLEKWVSRGIRTALLRKRVSAKSIAERASNWYENREGPRFLWMHIMEPHLPYYPGIRKASKVGLLNTYRSIVSYQRYGDNTPNKLMQVQRELYEECIRSFNETVPELIDFVGEDAIILAFGDHGEEFEHGHYDHERLYDECVHVPLYYKNIAEFADGPLRQVDLAPNLLNAIDIPIPDRWEGTIETPVSTQPAYMLTPENDTGLLHVGIRKENSKLIRSYDRQNGNIVRNEYYNLEDDPNEIKNIYNSVDVRKMEEKLEQFLSDHQAALDIDLSTNMETKIVESRLEDLGYK